MTRTTRTLAITALLLTAASTRTAAADTVTLTTGDVIHGNVTSQSAEAITLEHPVLGTLTIPASTAASVTIDAADAAVQAEPDPEVVTTVPTATAPTPEDVDDEADALPDVRPGLLGTGFLKGWTRSLSLSLNGSEGNTEKLNLTAGFAAGYEDDFDRWDFESAYTYGTDEGDRTDNDFYASLKKDWLLPDSRWFYFAEGRYDWDEFEDWDHRVSAGGGLGYNFLERENLFLRGRAGLGFSKEFGSEDDDIVPEAILGLAFGWEPTDNQEITVASTLYPALDDFFEFRNITTAAWKIAIDQDYGLSLKLGVENEYESQTDDAEHNDLKYFAAIVYDF